MPKPPIPIACPQCGAILAEMAAHGRALTLTEAARVAHPIALVCFGWQQGRVLQCMTRERAELICVCCEQAGVVVTKTWHPARIDSERRHGVE